MAVLTKRQLAILHVARKQLGLDDATYRDMLEAYDGVRSAKDLSLHGFRQIMNCFVDAGFGTKLLERSGMATPSQIRKIYASWWALSGSYYDEGQERTSLKGFLKKRFAVDHEKFLTFKKANAVIEAIKRIKGRLKSRLKAEG